MTDGHVPLECPACQAIARADELEDGSLLQPHRFASRHERHRFDALLEAQDRAADAVTGFAGSLRFVYIHSVWFGLWIFLNVGLFGGALEFDKYPFGLLTMIVSLEAIFLSAFVMVSQNRQAARADVRSQLDFETNLRSEIWAVHIGHALNIDPNHVEKVVQDAIAGSRSQLEKRGLR
jgi:uncharacterized membrane protein